MMLVGSKAALIYTIVRIASRRCNPPMIGIAPAACCAGRALLDWSQAHFADAARVGSSTVRNFEAGRSILVTNNLDAIRRALEAAGVEFIPENAGGAGVRLRKPDQ